MSDTSQVANPGSTLGEAVGALVEKEVNRLMRPIAEEYGCVYATAGKPDPRTARATKLLMQDAAGNNFQVDAVITNSRFQPLVLIESKYILNRSTFATRNIIVTRVAGYAQRITVCVAPIQPFANLSLFLREAGARPQKP